MNAERGTFKFRVHFHGRPTHTATARVDGINPIAHAARAVLALEKPLTGFHPEIGEGVRSVNMISAGVHQSQVPAECVLLVDRRLLPGETKETGLAEAEREIRDALRDCPDARFELVAATDRHGRLLYTPPTLSPWDGIAVQAIARAHRAVMGTAAQPFVDWFGATDGRFFRMQGIEAISYGPAGSGAHGSNEYVEIPSLTIQLKVLVATVLDLLGGSREGIGPGGASGGAATPNDGDPNWGRQ
jgi:acetylornithine deacetylase/succinyl-diaminopimelate desuccinylase-like protein